MSDWRPFGTFLSSSLLFGCGQYLVAGCRVALKHTHTHTHTHTHRVEGSMPSSKPHLFLHTLSIWPPCGTVLTGGTEGSMLSSKPSPPLSSQAFHLTAMWYPVWLVDCIMIWIDSLMNLIEVASLDCSCYLSLSVNVVITYYEGFVCKPLVFGSIALLKLVEKPQQPPFQDFVCVLCACVCM